MSAAGAEALMASPHLRKLNHLRLWGNSLGEDMRERLQKHFGRGVCAFSET